MTRNTKDITAFDYMVSALMGIVAPDSVRVKSGKYTLDMSQTFWENDNTYSFAISINNTPMAIVWPEAGIADVFADHRLMVDYAIDLKIPQALHKAGYVNMGANHEFSPLGGLAQTWKRKPAMYLTTTDDRLPRSVDGMHTYDPNGFTWSDYSSAVIPGVNGHQCTTYIPAGKEGYTTWAVDYMGPHAYAEFGNFGIMHTFGAVKLLHRVVPHEFSWQKGVFCIDESPSFPGWWQGETWNGFACPYFTKEVAEEVISWALSTRSDKEVSPDHEENYDLVMPEPISTPVGELYPVGTGIWTWWNER